MSKVRAPWTPEQVAALNCWQAAGFVHPFTCGNSGSHNLVPTVNGWVCPHCNYTQDWAWAVMFDEPPKPDLLHP